MRRNPTAPCSSSYITESCGNLSSDGVSSKSWNKGGIYNVHSADDDVNGHIRSLLNEQPSPAGMIKPGHSITARTTVSDGSIHSYNVSLIQ